VSNSGKIIFVTGTDTGVGKTFLTAQLLYHLRQKGCHALAMKPFCSGRRSDVILLQSLQRGDLRDEEMNPFYFPEAVSPLVSLKMRHKDIQLRDVLQRVRRMVNSCEMLLIEGSGGVLVPLGLSFTVLDLISEVGGRVIVVGRNRLGTINHTWLTVNALLSRGIKNISVVLMDNPTPDESSTTNQRVLLKLTSLPVFRMPFFGRKISRFSQIRVSHKKNKKMLARLLG
jgi:dethiobiotin synthetase